MLNLCELASPRRFERPAPSLGGKCSILLSYGDKFNLLYTSRLQLLQEFSYVTSEQEALSEFKK
jgi:hypothetical protein